MCETLLAGADDGASASYDGLCGVRVGSVQPLMRMYFHGGIPDYVLFYSWVPQDELQYMFTILAIVSLGVLSGGLKAWRARRMRALRLKTLGGGGKIVAAVASQSLGADIVLESVVEDGSTSTTTTTMHSARSGRSSSDGGSNRRRRRTAARSRATQSSSSDGDQQQQQRTEEGEEDEGGSISPPPVMDLASAACECEDAPGVPSATTRRRSAGLFRLRQAQQCLPSLLLTRHFSLSYNAQSALFAFFINLIDYSLMLIAMTFNAGLFIATITGIALGTFGFAHHFDSPSESDCH